MDFLCLSSVISVRKKWMLLPCLVIRMCHPLDIEAFDIKRSSSIFNIHSILTCLSCILPSQTSSSSSQSPLSQSQSATMQQTLLCFNQLQNTHIANHLLSWQGILPKELEGTMPAVHCEALTVLALQALCIKLTVCASAAVCCPHRQSGGKCGSVALRLSNNPLLSRLKGKAVHHFLAMLHFTLVKSFGGKRLKLAKLQGLQACFQPFVHHPPGKSDNQMPSNNPLIHSLCLPFSPIGPPSEWSIVSSKLIAWYWHHLQSSAKDTG